MTQVIVKTIVFWIVTPFWKIFTSLSKEITALPANYNGNFLCYHSEEGSTFLYVSTYVP
jgi:hypothetical protein